MSSQYGELQPTNSWDQSVSFGHPSKFQRVSHPGFVTAPTLLNGGQQNFAQCLAISWACTLYIYIFRGSCCLTEFRHVQNSPCVQVFENRLAFGKVRGYFFGHGVHCIIICLVLVEFVLFMAVLHSRCGHYIFVLFLSFFFFPCLISAVTNWMSTILLHMVWP